MGVIWNKDLAWRMGVIAAGRLPDGRVVSITQMIGSTMLAVGQNAQTWDEAWDYPNALDCLIAAVNWDGTGEPEDGWERHQPSERRRPHGDPTREYVSEY